MINKYMIIFSKYNMLINKNNIFIIFNTLFNSLITLEKEYYERIDFNNIENTRQDVLNFLLENKILIDDLEEKEELRCQKKYCVFFLKCLGYYCLKEDNKESYCQKTIEESKTLLEEYLYESE